MSPNIVILSQSDEDLLIARLSDFEHVRYAYLLLLIQLQDLNSLVWIMLKNPKLQTSYKSRVINFQKIELIEI